MAVTVDYTRHSFSSTRPPEYSKDRIPQYNDQIMSSVRLCRQAGNGTKKTSSVASPAASPVADLIFVHGLSGGSFKTWKALAPCTPARALLSSSYDCVVVGSGYGGATALHRMASQGELCSGFERGRERWPVDKELPMEVPPAVKRLSAPPLLDSRFIKEPTVPFQPGEVFKVLWRDPRGDAGTNLLHLNSLVEQSPSSSPAGQEIDDAASREGTPASIAIMNPAAAKSLPRIHDYGPWSIRQAQLQVSWGTSESFLNLRHLWKVMSSSHWFDEPLSFDQTVPGSTVSSEDLISEDGQLALSHNGIWGVSELTRRFHQACLKQGVFGILEKAIDLLSLTGEAPTFDNPPPLMKDSLKGSSRTATTWNIVSRLLAPGITPLEDPG